LLSALLALPGCASRAAAPALRPAAASQAPVPAADVWRQFAGQLPAGSAIRIRTDTDRGFTATLLAVNQDGVTVQPRTRVPEPLRTLPFDSIERIEIVSEKGANMAKAAAVGGAVGAGTFLGLLMVLFAGIDD
jgi:hypothetical protein